MKLSFGRESSAELSKKPWFLNTHLHPHFFRVIECASDQGLWLELLLLSISEDTTQQVASWALENGMETLKMKGQICTFGPKNPQGSLWALTACPVSSVWQSLLSSSSKYVLSISLHNSSHERLVWEISIPHWKYFSRGDYWHGLLIKKKQSSLLLLFCFWWNPGCKWELQNTASK